MRGPGRGRPKSRTWCLLVSHDWRRYGVEKKPGPRTMYVTITTDGGFTGRGIGSASAEIDDDFLARLAVDSWQDSYTTAGADQVRYAVEIGGRRVMWMEGAAIPDDLRELYERVWGT